MSMSQCFCQTALPDRMWALTPSCPSAQVHYGLWKKKEGLSENKNVSTLLLVNNSRTQKLLSDGDDTVCFACVIFMKLVNSRYTDKHCQLA